MILTYNQAWGVGNARGTAPFQRSAGGAVVLCRLDGSGKNEDAIVVSRPYRTSVQLKSIEGGLQMPEKIAGRRPGEVAGVRIPDSKLATEATELVRAVSSDALFNHVIRTYVFGELFGRAGRLQYDSEALYLAAVMHDLGLTQKFQAGERFEVDGADAAREFLASHGVSEERKWLIWDAIALHTTVGIAHRKQPEVALVHLGAGADAIGLRLDEIPPNLLQQIVKAYPRREFKKVLLDDLTRIVRDKPQSAAFNFMADVAERHVAGFQAPNTCDLISAAPFEG
jgi:hypothetical protein